MLILAGIQRANRLPQFIEVLTKLQKKYGEQCRYQIVLAVKSELMRPGIEIFYDLEQKLHRKYQVTAPTLFFIRPDKYIGFRGRLSDEGALIKYLSTLYQKS